MVGRKTDAVFDRVLYDGAEFGMQAHPGSEEEQDYLGIPGLLEPDQVQLLLQRRQARQIVRHGHVTVNGRKVDVPSFQVNAGDEVAIREKSNKLIVIESAKEFASHGTMPSWLEVDRDNYKARVLSLPKREDIQLPVNEQLIVELYSK